MRSAVRGEHAVSTILLASLFAALLMASPASAHIVMGNAGGFGSGFEHPLTGADHFLAMFAVGV